MASHNIKHFMKSKKAKKCSHTLSRKVLKKNEGMNINQEGLAITSWTE